jgi:hypothetical protein
MVNAAATAIIALLERNALNVIHHVPTGGSVALVRTELLQCLQVEV